MRVITWKQGAGPHSVSEHRSEPEGHPTSAAARQCHPGCSQSSPQSARESLFGSGSHPSCATERTTAHFIILFI